MKFIFLSLVFSLHSLQADVTSGEMLITAALMGDTKTMESLLSAGINPNLPLRGGETPLSFAMLAGQAQIVQLLLAWHADPNAPISAARFSETPLQYAAQTGNVRIASINEAAYRGSTPLVRYLLQLHPDLAIPDQRSYSPLDNAIRNGKEDAALLLLDAEPIELQTPQFLGKTMDDAARKDESLVVEALLRHGAPVNGILPSGYTPLDAAAFAGAVKAVAILLDNSADPNLSGPGGTTPLEDAALKGFAAIAGMLLDHGAQVNHVNSGSGTTALYAAASFGKGEAVGLLLNRGANPNLCGANRKSPYQAALENGFGDVAAEIKSHGGANSCRQ
jgi:ankyrin repeat protein